MVLEANLGLGCFQPLRLTAKKAFFFLVCTVCLCIYVFSYVERNVCAFVYTARDGLVGGVICCQASLTSWVLPLVCSGRTERPVRAFLDFHSKQHHNPNGPSEAETPADVPETRSGASAHTGQLTAVCNSTPREWCPLLACTCMQAKYTH